MKYHLNAYDSVIVGPHRCCRKQYWNSIYGLRDVWWRLMPKTKIYLAAIDVGVFGGITFYGLILVLNVMEF